MIALSAGNRFTSGHPAAGWSFVGIFAVLPAAAYAIGRIRTRRIRLHPDRPVDRRSRQRLSTTVLVIGMAAIGVMTVVNAKPTDRIAAGIAVVFSFAVIALLTWAIVRGRHD